MKDISARAALELSAQLAATGLEFLARSKELEFSM